MSTCNISACNVTLPVQRQAQSVGAAYMQLNTANITPLGASSVLNGVGVIPTGCRTVYAHFASDQASTANGAKLQVSTDNTNWYDAAVGTLSAGGYLVLSFPSANNPLFYRTQLTNGATPQTRLYAAIWSGD